MVGNRDYRSEILHNILIFIRFAAAYLAPYEEKIVQQGLHHRCRYSLGSIALWSRAAGVEQVLAGQPRRHSTTRHAQYYKV